MVLAAIAAAVTVRARNQGRTTTCLNNLAQIGKALHLYAADHDDRIPPYATTTTRLLGATEWIDAKPELLVAAFDQYGVTREIWRCPYDKNFGTARVHGFWHRGFTFTSYEVSDMVQSLSEKGQPPWTMQISNVPDPATVIYLNDAIESLDVGPPWNRTAHEADFNCLLLDGHVERRRLAYR